MRVQEYQLRQHRPLEVPESSRERERHASHGRRWIAAALVVLVSAGMGSLLVARFGQPSETAYTAEADAYVSTAHPHANYGGDPTLRADATPRIHSYLRFRLDGLAGRPVRAQLRLWSSTGNLAGYSVRVAPDASWKEPAITSSHRPAAGEAIARSGPFGPNAWTSTDVTSLVVGSDEVTLVVSTKSTQAIAFDSREGIHKPQLMVQTTEVPGRS